MAAVHLVLQGKGGVGKSFVSSLLAQHLRASGTDTVCVDTDPVNATFAGYAALEVRRIELQSGDDIDPRAFDALIEAVMAAGEKQAVVVDNGAATFVPLCAYLRESDAVSLLGEAGHAVRFHTVVTGGQGLRDTLVGFDALCAHFPGVPVVVWVNEYFGRAAEGGKSFEDFRTYKAHEDRVEGLITLPAVRPETYGRDLDEMLRRRLTFDEALSDKAFGLMARQRLTTWRRDVASRLGRAGL